MGFEVRQKKLEGNVTVGGQRGTLFVVIPIELGTSLHGVIIASNISVSNSNTTYNWLIGYSV
jgi:hypothetical protein